MAMYRLVCAFSKTQMLCPRWWRWMYFILFILFHSRYLLFTTAVVHSPYIVSSDMYNNASYIVRGTRMCYSIENFMCVWLSSIWLLFSLFFLLLWLLLLLWLFEQSPWLHFDVVINAFVTICYFNRVKGNKL